MAACAKHFVGDGGTTNGDNEANVVSTRHDLLSIHMPAYYDSIIKGVATVMASYSSLNGRKMHANHDLLTGFLKGTLKFKVMFKKMILRLDKPQCSIWKLVITHLRITTLELISS